MGLFLALTGTPNFMPHGYCYFWNPFIVRLHAYSDAAIVLAYYAIPSFLLFLVSRRKDLPYRWMFVFFAVFIISCGTTHLMEIISIWRPVYWLSGSIKAWTGLISLVTAVLLVWIVPKIMELRSPVELEAANRKLRDEMSERVKSQEALIQKTEQLVRSRAELEQLELFSYVATHDLREPLYKIISFGELLKMHSGAILGEKGQQDLGKIQSAARRMDRMIEELREYSKIGQTKDKDVQVDLTSIVKEVLADLDLRIKEADAQVTVDPLPAIKGDPIQLRLLFQNLIANAVKFRRRDESCRVTVRGEVADGGRCVEILVEDNGIGFEEKYLDQIFKPFQRLHTRQEYDGSGLGLAICQKVALNHGGNVTARSVPGQGTVFIVSLTNG